MPFHLQYFDQSCLGVGNSSSVREASFSALSPVRSWKTKPSPLEEKDKGNVEGYRIIESLLHSVADAVVVVLGLDDRNRNVGFVIKDVIGALGLPASNQFSADDDAAFGKSDLLAHLHHPVPARALYGGAYELGADVAFAKIFLVDCAVDCIRPLATDSSQPHFTPEASFRANARGIPPTSRAQIGATAPVRLHRSYSVRKSHTATGRGVQESGNGFADG
jgi:hypothetical protein